MSSGGMTKQEFQDVLARLSGQTIKRVSPKQRRILIGLAALIGVVALFIAVTYSVPSIGKIFFGGNYEAYQSALYNLWPHGNTDESPPVAAQPAPQPKVEMTQQTVKGKTIYVVDQCTDEESGEALTAIRFPLPWLNGTSVDLKLFPFKAVDHMTAYCYDQLWQEFAGMVGTDGVVNTAKLAEYAVIAQENPPYKDQALWQKEWEKIFASTLDTAKDMKSWFMIVPCRNITDDTPSYDNAKCVASGSGGSKKSLAPNGGGNSGNGNSGNGNNNTSAATPTPKPTDTPVPAKPTATRVILPTVDPAEAARLALVENMVQRGVDRALANGISLSVAGNCGKGMSVPQTATTKNGDNLQIDCSNLIDPNQVLYQKAIVVATPTPTPFPPEVSSLATALQYNYGVNWTKAYIDMGTIWNSCKTGGGSSTTYWTQYGQVIIDCNSFANPYGVQLVQQPVTFAAPPPANQGVCGTFASCMTPTLPAGVAVCGQNESCVPTATPAPHATVAPPPTATQSWTSILTPQPPATCPPFTSCH